MGVNWPRNLVKGGLYFNLDFQELFRLMNLGFPAFQDTEVHKFTSLSTMYFLLSFVSIT